MFFVYLFSIFYFLNVGYMLEQFIATFINAMFCTVRIY